MGKVFDMYAFRKLGPYARACRVTVRLEYNFPIPRGGLGFGFGHASAGWWDPLGDPEEQPEFPTDYQRFWSRPNWTGTYWRANWVATQQRTLSIGEELQWRLRFNGNTDDNPTLPDGFIYVEVTEDLELDGGGFPPSPTLYPDPNDGGAAPAPTWFAGATGDNFTQFGGYNWTPGNGNSANGWMVHPSVTLYARNYVTNVDGLGDCCADIGPSTTTYSAPGISCALTGDSNPGSCVGYNESMKSQTFPGSSPFAATLADVAFGVQVASISGPDQGIGCGGVPMQPCGIVELNGAIELRGFQADLYFDQSL